MNRVASAAGTGSFGTIAGVSLVDMLATIPAWHGDAACAEHTGDRDLWWPVRGQSSEPAKRICESCLVRDECLKFALAEHINDGIWGGLSGRQRRQYYRRRLIRQRLQHDDLDDD